MSIGLAIAIVGIWLTTAYAYSKKGDPIVFVAAIIAIGILATLSLR